MHVDNADEITSQIFIDYFMLIGINIKHFIASIYTQNSLTESLIKYLQSLNPY